MSASSLKQPPADLSLIDSDHSGVLRFASSFLLGLLDYFLIQIRYGIRIPTTHLLALFLVAFDQFLKYFFVNVHPLLSLGIIALDLLLPHANCRGSRDYNTAYHLGWGSIPGQEGLAYLEG